MKDGSYLLTAYLEIDFDNVGLFGAGKATKIYTTSNIALLFINNADNVTIKDIWFYGAGTGKGTNQGIIIDASAATLIHSSVIENCGDYGIYTRNASDDTIITSCVIKNCFDDGIFLGGSNISISGNYIHNITGNGINGIGSNSVITDNVIIDNTQHGINLITSSNLSIVGNRITGNDSGNTITYSGIYLQNSDDCNITGNIIKDNDNYEIALDANCDNNVIVGNNLNGADHEGTVNDLGSGNVFLANGLDSSGNIYHKGRFVRMP